MDQKICLERLLNACFLPILKTDLIYVDHRKSRLKLEHVTIKLITEVVVDLKSS